MGDFQAIEDAKHRRVISQREEIKERRAYLAERLAGEVAA